MKLFFLALMVMVGLFGCVWYFVGGNDYTVEKISLEVAFWESWTLLMDTGVQGEAVAWGSRGAAALATILGLIFSAVLTGFVCDAVKVREG